MSTGEQRAAETGGDRTPGRTLASTARGLLNLGGAYAIGIFHLVALIVGLAIISFSQVEHRPIALLWGLACLASGGMIGFLFGIPRALQQPSVLRQPAPTSPNPGQAGGDSSADRPGASVLEVNTNLEQISDWLTKIIVGIGLVELRNLPGYVGQLADFMALGVGNRAESKALIVASLVYFSVVGFIGSYLLTRTYLSKVIKDFDDLTLSPNDIKVPIGGMQVSLTDASRQVRNSLADLREQIIRLHPDLLAQNESTPRSLVVAATPERPKTVLWVDDEPSDNSLDLEEMQRLNIKVEAVKTTADALKILESKPFDVVISDMVRVEGGVTNPKAGIDILEAVRRIKPDLPFVIMSDPANVDAFKNLEQTTPRLVVTSSRTELFAALRQFL